MIALNFTNPCDGCDLSQQEVYSLLQIGLEEGETISEIEFPVDGRIEPTDRALLLLAIPEEAS